MPSQKAGVTSRLGVNLRSSSYVQYFGEGVTRTDISGRKLVKAGWGDEKRLTAPLPFWQGEQTNGIWTAAFRRNALEHVEHAGGCNSISRSARLLRRALRPLEPSLQSRPAA